MSVHWSDILRAQITAFGPLEEGAMQALLQPWQEVVVKRKVLLTRMGEREHYLYLVLEGVQRAVYTDGDREATLVFTYAPSFSGVLDSFLTGLPATSHLETLTASRLLRLHYNDLMAAAADHPAIHTWLWKSLALVLYGTMQRQVELLTATAPERFTALLRRSPQVLNLIPHKYLANYIGVDATTFSKMLGSVRL